LKVNENTMCVTVVVKILTLFSFLVPACVRLCFLDKPLLKEAVPFRPP